MGSYAIQKLYIVIATVLSALGLSDIDGHEYTRYGVRRKLQLQRHAIAIRCTVSVCQRRPDFH